MTNKVDWATAGTATVKLTISKKHGTFLPMPLHGCFVEKDDNLETFVAKYINPSSADWNKFNNSRNLFYSPVNHSFEGKVAEAVISYEEIAKKQKTKTCTVIDPLVISFDGHFFLCCDSEDLNKSTFLEKYSKVVRNNQTLVSSKEFYGLGMDCKFSSFQMIRQCQQPQSNIYNVIGKTDHDKLEESGPLLCDEKTLVGCYMKKSNYNIEIKVFEKIQEMTSASSTDGGFPRGGTGQAAGTQTDPGGGTVQAAGTQASTPGGGTGQDAGTQTPTSGGGTGQAAGIQESTPGGGTGQAADTQTPTSGGGTGQQTLADLFRRKTSVLDGLCLRLDNEYRVIQNWKHLADLLHAPNDVKNNCKCSTKHSPTKLLFGMPNVFSVTIKKLLEELIEMRRNDVVNKISEKISEADRNKTIDETLLKDDDLFDEVALLLDKDSARLDINWRKLGQRLQVFRDDLLQIGRGNNPANQLFLYAYDTLEPEKLKAGYFRNIVDHDFPDRNDVKQFLDTLGVTSQDDRSMKDVFPPESDNLLKLCCFLNRNAGNTLKDWKHLASAWEINRDIYKVFDDPEKPKPTKILLEDWLVQDRPYFTVEELCCFLTKIERIDVREYLKDEARS